MEITSERSMNSMFKEITTLNGSGAFDKVKTSVETHLCLRTSGHSSATQDEVNNILTIIKKLAETKQQVVVKGLDENLLEGRSGIESPPPLTPPEDVIYNIIIEPLEERLWDHLNLILNDHCQAYILTLPSTRGSTSFSTHEMLSLVHKLVRTGLTLLKRMCSANLKLKSPNENVRSLLQSFGEGLCDLLQEKNFDVSLDVKCNIGISLCHILNILTTSDNEFFSFIENLFSKNPIPSLTKDRLQTKIVTCCAEDLNRITMAYGVLGNSFLMENNFNRTMRVIGENILSIVHGTQEATNVGTARVLDIWADKLSSSGREILEELSPLFVDLEWFIFNYLCGHIDSVKTCCRNIIGSLAKIYDRMEDANCFNRVSEFLQRVVVKTLHIKWIGISCISRATPKAIAIMDIEINLPEVLLCCQRTSISPCSDSYANLTILHFPKISVSEWERIWVDPLFTNQKRKKLEINWDQKRAIITIILKSRDKAVKEAIMRSVVGRMNSGVELGNESALLAVGAIKLAAELEVNMSGSSNLSSFRDIVPRDRLDSWLINGSPQIRMTGFSLLVESRKTSELFVQEDFESLKLVFGYSFLSQNPAFRQQFISYFKKLLRRLKDSRNLILRTKDEENIQNYTSFLHWLWDFLASEDGLFPGSNFGRRCQALECLAELTAQFSMEVLGVKPSCPKNIQYLLWLEDTFEHNKEKAIEILLKIPMPELEKEMEISDEIFNRALSLCESVKPPNSLTGRYLVVFLIKKLGHKAGEKYSVWSVLTTLYEKLQLIIQNIEATSLIEVAAETPMYGYVRCIRMILAETKEYKEKDECLKYRSYCSELIDLCLKLDDILFPVLGSAAPEGFMPGLPDTQSQNSKVVRSINAQMLLVCSWRSMKDVCLLLTEMCDLFPLEGESDDYVLSFKQVVCIGDHLSYLLKTLMHRGVFEQVYIGFKQLAARLYISRSEKLNKLPEIWLNDAMDEELVNSKCITRRSGGLPFLVQALLTPVSTDEVFVNKFVERLFNSSPNSTSSATARIHAMNVLRSLFRDANFSRTMMPQVPLGLQLAFKGLKATDWTERNSGLMLFGAIIRRTFGQKLNLMSAPSFFRKFPQMYDFLLEEIRTCCSNVEKKTYILAMSDFTYHVLILLSSFACAGVIEDNHFKLCEFVDPIRACGSSPDVHVRKMAAKALIPFLTGPSEKAEVIKSVFTQLVSDPVMSPNAMHGRLLQILTLLQAVPQEEVRNEIILHFNDFVSKSQIWCSKSPKIFEILFDICLNFGKAAESSYKILKVNFNTNFDKYAVNRRPVPGLPCANKRKGAAEVYFVLSECGAKDFTEFVFNWIQSEDLVFLEQLLEYLLTCITNSEKTCEEWGLVLESLVIRYLREEFDCQSDVEEKFLDVISKMSGGAFTEWTHFVKDEDFLQLFDRLISICEVETGTTETKASAMKILGRLTLKGIPLEKEEVGEFCELLTLYCDSQMDDTIRLAAGTCIPNLPCSRISTFSELQQLQIWFAIITLSQDDEPVIREEISRKVGHLNHNTELCERRTLEILLELFLTEFVQKHPFEGLVLLIGLLVRDDFEIRAEEADDGEEDRLFDKSEMNSFHETILLAKVVEDTLLKQPKLTENLRHHFHNSFMNSDLGEFFAFVSNSTIPSPKWETLTLHSLCEIVFMKLTSYVDVESCSTSVSSFPDKHLVLEWIRKFVQNVFC